MPSAACVKIIKAIPALNIQRGNIKNNTINNAKYHSISSVALILSILSCLLICVCVLVWQMYKIIWNKKAHQLAVGGLSLRLPNKRESLIRLQMKNTLQSGEIH
jgi:hypothetical protein